VTTIPTVGFNVETVTYKNVKFNVWVSGCAAQESEAGRMSGHVPETREAVDPHVSQGFRSQNAGLCLIRVLERDTALVHGQPTRRASRGAVGSGRTNELEGLDGQRPVIALRSLPRAATDRDLQKTTLLRPLTRRTSEDRTKSDRFGAITTPARRDSSS